jgi:hypothetical protein
MFYTKVFIFVSSNDSIEIKRGNAFKIIWFYLVRAEVVLWWHCLIFFIYSLSINASNCMAWLSLSLPFSLCSLQ